MFLTECIQPLPQETGGGPGATKNLSLRTIWSDHYRVASYLVDYRGELSLPGLLSLIQEAAWEHVDRLGYGYQATLARGLLWALIRQKIDIVRWPGWGEELRVRTWLRPLQGLVVTRDFQFWHGQELFCEGTTLYIMLHKDERHPAPAPMQAHDFYVSERGPHDPEKIAPRPGHPQLARFTIRTSDLDMHAHVNNTRIGQWLFDAVPAQAHDQQRIHSYEVEFLAEMHARETISVEAGPLGEGKWHFQGRREEDGKVVFTARVGTVPR